MIGVDVGGTFTDVVAISGGEIVTVKVPTVVGRTEEGVLAGAREAGVGDAGIFNHASTQGLNAIITRRLPKIGFLTTLGHRDMLDGGRVYRPAAGLTDPHWRRSFGDAGRPLVPRYLRRGIRERVSADGTVVIPLDEDHARTQLRVLKRCGVQGIAVCLVNSYVDGKHESRLRELVAEELGTVPCSISSDVSPLAKEYARASTTVIDACMRIIYGHYTERLQDGLHESGFRGSINYANCAAQLAPVEAAMERPFEIVFAGPAAGTMASRHFGGGIGVAQIICADVGGTSCDFSVITDGRSTTNTTFELEHDLSVNALSTEIRSIGAGGGSVVGVDAGGAITVGPASAGSDPGPASYGRGGTVPTTTDTFLLMGVLDPGDFAAGRLKLDRALAREAFDRLDTALPFEQRVRFAFRMAVNNIAEGVVNTGVRHGIDTRDFALMAFGAAGPMLLPAVLDIVNCAECIVPPHPGLFSALGLVSSDQVFSASRTAYIELAPAATETIGDLFAEMETKLRERLGFAQHEVRITRSFDGYLAGQSWETPFVPAPPGPIDTAAVEEMVWNFHDTYQARTGNRFEALGVEAVTFRVQAIVPVSKVSYPMAPAARTRPPVPRRRREVRYLAERPIEAPEYERSDLHQDDEIRGPAIVRESLSTTFIVPGQVMKVGRYGELRIRNTA
ncbi:hydantoinase/oxoprolinase family protein [Amycolatopsis sp. RM579]|uniref:Hydantoinase/oxoprolinase family protein n=2 Tax=Amycolatopsis pithecellobii TaxID=664692 RepID=A0A6N7YRH6_9PSEU|nr:hydantoinase/oxoprolinase family protein [Amycolatopsis pithecellobii]